MNRLIKICVVVNFLKICAVAQIFTPTPANKCPYNLDYFNAVRPETRLERSFEKQLVHLMCEQHQREIQLAQEFSALVDDQLRRNLDLTFDQFFQTKPVVEFSQRYLEVSLTSSYNQTYARESWKLRAHSMFAVPKFELMVHRQIALNEQMVERLMQQQQHENFMMCVIGSNGYFPFLGPLIYPICQAQHYWKYGLFNDTYGNPWRVLDFLTLCCLAIILMESRHVHPEDEPLPTH